MVECDASCVCDMIAVTNLTGPQPTRWRLSDSNKCRVTWKIFGNQFMQDVDYFYR